jgi:hypothetical protein
MNFTELKDELFARGTNYLEEDAETEARAERWLNQAYREILNLQVWPFLQDTETGTDGAGFVSIADFRKIRAVTDVSSGFDVALGRSSFEELLSDYGDLTDTGTPAWYYVDGDDTVKAFPVGGTIKVYYIKRVGPMSGTDDPVFDEEYHNLIVDKAMIKAYIDSDNFEAAAALREETNLALTAMAEDYFLDSRETMFIPADPYDG